MRNKNTPTRYIFIIYLVGVFSSCQWVDTQTEAMDEWPDKIGSVMCEDQTFYILPLSCRWKKLITCNEIDEYIDLGIDYVNDYYNLEINLKLTDYLECCNDR